MQFTQNVSPFNQATAGAASSTFDKLVPDDSEDIIGSVVTTSGRQNVYSTGSWSSSGAWTTYHHSWNNADSQTQGWNQFMGDGRPNATTDNMYSNDGAASHMRKLEYAHGDRMGWNYRDFHYEGNQNGNYAGVTWRCIPVRNPTDTSITKNFKTMLSSIESTYAGAAIHAYIPNSGKYSEVTSGTWDNAWRGGSNGFVERNGDITVAAKSTVLIMVNSSHKYMTSYQFKDTNMCINLDEFFTGGLVCDLRMLQALATVRAGQEGAYNSSNPSHIYPLCATYYGDR
jgi:hypothetical protein|tara:strand:- start:10 stop:864 length:855 start_codon:yes stop_codon:yes gene_type:complete